MQCPVSPQEWMGDGLGMKPEVPSITNDRGYPLFFLPPVQVVQY